jgi:hypothetical protein
MSSAPCNFCLLSVKPSVAYAALVIFPPSHVYVGFKKIFGHATDLVVSFPKG